MEKKITCVVKTDVTAIVVAQRNKMVITTQLARARKKKGVVSIVVDYK